MRLSCVLILWCLATQSAFAGLDYKQLAATKRDQPPTVTTIEVAKFPIQFGEIAIPNGSTVKLLAISPEGVLSIEYNGQKYSIPAAKTDLERRVTEIRSRRIVIDSVEYEDCEFSSPTATDVTMKHRRGIEQISLSKLPTGLQKRFGYDLQKRMTVEAEIVGDRMESTNSVTSINGAFGVSLGALLSEVNVIGKRETSDDKDAHGNSFKFKPSRYSEMVKEYFVWVTPKSKKVYCIEGLGVAYPVGSQKKPWEDEAKALLEVLVHRYGHSIKDAYEEKVKDAYEKKGFWASIFDGPKHYGDDGVQIGNRRITVSSVDERVKNAVSGSNYSRRLQVKYIDDFLEVSARVEASALRKEREAKEAEAKAKEAEAKARTIKKRLNPADF